MQILNFFKKNKNSPVAYFTMELGLDPSLPTYSGGLGVLAGDTLKAMADIGQPMVAVTMLNEKGYFKQTITKDNRQIEKEDAYDKEKYLKLTEAEIKIKIEGRDVWVRAWKYNDKASAYAKKLEVYFLDTNIEKNSEYDRSLTSYLYGKDRKYRICQEAVLGIGGIRILKKLGIENIHKYHINEGHAGFLGVELLKAKLGKRKKITEDDLIYVRNKCAFTTHTPIAAGHDKFELNLVKNVLGDYLPEMLFNKSIDEEGKFNMTLVALNLASFVNGVAKRHGEKTKEMFPGYEINYITNGIHSATWVSKYFFQLFDKYLDNWQSFPYSLRYAKSIPSKEIWQAHAAAKADLLEFVYKKTKIKLNKDVLTIGFARRFTLYKRSDLIFHDLDKLREVAMKGKGIQIIMAGKSHPGDESGKEMMHKILDIKDQINKEEKNIKVVFLENYDVAIAKLMVAGSDVWLNTPQRPFEASGTSGMKAALNGVPHLSTMDGWWLEGCIEGATGWGIGPHPNSPRFKKDLSPFDEAEDLYKKLADEILPTFYNNRERWVDIMSNCIAVNASFFNAYRMANEYVEHVY